MTQQEEEWCGDTLERRGDMVHVCTLPAHGSDVGHRYVWINKPWQQKPIPARPPVPEPPEKPASKPLEPYVGPLFGNSDSVYRRMQGVLGGAGWIPPEDDRTASPDPDQKIPEGVEGQQQSKPNRTKPDKPQETPQTGGTAMASVAEVKGALAAADAKIEEAQQAAHSVIGLLDEAEQMYVAALESANQDTIQNIAGPVHMMKEHISDAIQGGEAAKEQSQGYAARL